MSARKVILPNAILLGEVCRFLDEGRSVELMTKGASMSPFIRGERDSVELVKRDKVEVGDIVLCQITPGHYVLHRIHRLNGERVQLKGDGNLDGTEACTLAEVCGTVDFIIRKGKRRINCNTRCFKSLSRMWVNSPRLVRKYCLGIYRRLKFL